MVGEEPAAVVVRRREGAWRVREWTVRCGGETVARAAAVCERDGRPLLVWLGADRTLGTAVLGARGGAAPALGGGAAPGAGRGAALAGRLARQTGAPCWLLRGGAAPRHLEPALQHQLFLHLFPTAEQSQHDGEQHEAPTDITTQ